MVLRALLPGVRRVHAQVAAYAAAWDAANREARAGQGPLWVALGDSTAQGIGAPSPDDGYVGQLRRILDARSGSRWRVVNVSRSGARTADVLSRQLVLLEQLDAPPDLVTCAVGANDVWPTPLPVLLASMRELIGRLPPGAVIGTLPQGLRRHHAEPVNDLIRAEAPAAGLLVADVWAHTGPPWHGKLAADRFHPGALGYAHWAAAFAEALEARFPPPPSDSH